MFCLNFNLTSLPKISLRLCAAFACFCVVQPNSGAQGLGTRAIDERTGAAPDADDYDEYTTASVYDPLEGFNRKIFIFNDWAYTEVLRPVTASYEFIVRPPVNRLIGNFYDNLRTPVRLVNCLLQGKLSRASLETQKFVVNTVGGLGGFIRQSDNVPRLASVPREDFGQTLGVWGVAHGPYLVVPIFGGFSLRDLGGRVSDTVVSPLGWEYIKLGDREWLAELDWEWQTAITVTDAFSTFPSALELYGQLKQSALDPYLSIREGTRRYRDADTAR
jgi:phospholipid-binding lipoprotein MlaA